MDENVSKKKFFDNFLTANNLR